MVTIILAFLEKEELAHLVQRYHPTQNYPQYNTPIPRLLVHLGANLFGFRQRVGSRDRDGGNRVLLKLQGWDVIDG
jgi:hypothetical protein